RASRGVTPPSPPSPPPRAPQKRTHAAPADGIETLVVRITTDDGLTGLGNVMIGVAAARPIIERHLTPILVGADPFDRELLWETMFRSTLNYGRKGVAIAAISGVAIALWD